ncbi:cupin domain-containing protein [Bradyrhizobium pachyrhizi]|uniref:JmjC domain-containing protein n=1 Tax=Bradyrhizobium pachyrhizi TaxID=280333 RepID=UPI0024B183AE|nr:cupin domain-containing protein [Bradyrhizobium pachyrhizi]WFU53622.1 cupin domain-containing protein [Bradyrhizobium pachyrhizi]
MPSEGCLAGSPSGLEDLVGDRRNFFATYWAKEPAIFDSNADLSSLISETEIWNELECGLLSRPYFTVFNEGVRSAIHSITTTRVVAGHRLNGFADVDQIKAEFAQGGTFKLSQVEHWHKAIKSLVNGLRDSFAGNLEAFVFLSPPGKTAMRAHTDGAHVFVLQIAGEKDWVVGRLNESSHSNSTLHEGEIDPDNRLEFTLRAGQVLYMPHGCPHYATARTGNSIHLAITIEEPTAMDMANVILANFMATETFAALEKSHHQLPMPDKIQRLSTSFQQFLIDRDIETMLRESIELRKR